jgi:hypothetical protein
MTTGPALACPRQMLCVVELNRTAPEIAHAPTPSPSVAALDVRTVQLPADRGLTFEAPARPDPDAVEMPWIWRVLRDQVYARMPRYEQPQRFTLVLSPVVVASPSDTVPGVGVAGNF